ncbi:MAG: type IX secretion system sortase PorU [Bacteroidales bacterium]|nr:type IX secretion system sortase PorU [Bacteroidales bacterium]
MSFRIKYTLLAIFLSVASYSFCIDASQYANSSALSTGNWFKMQIKESGIYKITYEELKSLGINNPDNVGIYGYGGFLLPESFKEPYIDDLPEIAIWKEKGNDGVFGAGDYILFYGKGLIRWKYNTKEGVFEHTNNHYSQYAYYFLHEKENEKSKEITSQNENIDLTTCLKAENFDDYYLHEKDLTSVSTTGRNLYGEFFGTTTSQNFSVTLKGIDTDYNGKVSLSFIAKASVKPTVSLSINNNEIIKSEIGISSGEYQNAAGIKKIENWETEKKETNTVNIKYSRSGDKNVHLDYFRIQYRRKLQPYAGYTFFRNTDNIGNDVLYTINNVPGNVMIWDISAGETPVQLETNTINETQKTVSVKGNQSLRELVLIDKTKNFLSATKIEKIANQDLHALPFCDMIIIAPPAFVSYAQKLADEHNIRDGLTCIVVTPETIYNEFSSGTPDATAYRRFIKMFYDRANASVDNFAFVPKHLLLYGDGSYDNRFISNEWKNISSSNFLLTFQSEESLNEIISFVSDDYFGFLDDNEGTALTEDLLDIGIGRFPVRTDAEAKAALEKTITYMDNKTLGEWKNNLVWVADDGNSSDGFNYYHMSNSEILATYTEKNHPEFINNKINFDAFKKETIGGKAAYPGARDKLYKLFKDGVLLFNYTGHGGTTALADEGIVTMSDIAKNMNQPQWPLWITAACDFCRFDDVATSAGEEVFLHPTGAGIALYTTTRVVNGAQNFNLNEQLIHNIFMRKGGKRLTLGEIMKNTKRSLGKDYNKLNFLLIGDPALKLVYPEYHVKITQINGINVDEGSTISLKALETISIAGEILDTEGKLDPTFTGDFYTKIFDSQQTITCLNNNKKNNAFTYSDYSNVLFTNKDSVKNGKFQFTFIVPKDISYSNQSGKMNFYASKDDGTQIKEAQGAFLDFIVGGTVDDMEDDGTGPEIKQIYLNDSSFVSGATVNESPLLFSRISDKNGINISGSGIGHDIIVRIDNDPNLTYSVNDYFKFLPGSYQEGYISYSIPELTDGQHTLELTVWNLYNNVSIESIDFNVEKGLDPEILDFTLGRNPVKENAIFNIRHNRPETNIEIGIYVYNLSGALVWEHHEQGESSALQDYTINWNLITNSGGRLKPGIYLTKATLNTNGSKTSSKTKKMVVLAQ